MDEDLVRNIASESQENKMQRELLERKVGVLAKGMEICKRHAAHRSTGEAVNYVVRKLH
jgi:hypothetical protein